MDFSFRQNEEDLKLIDDLFGNKTLKCCPEFMDENWSSGTDDILGSIFPMDFQNNLTDHQGEFGTLEGYNRNMKIEHRIDDYEKNLSILPEPLLSHSSGLSSNSSDSGLSSDNIDAEISPPYEPTSLISAGPSKIAKGDERSLRLELVQPRKIKINNDYKPKVIVQKVPQVMTLSNNFQTHLTTTKMQKHQLQTLTRQPNHIQTIMNGGRKSDIKIVKLSPQIFTTSNNKAVTIQVKNSNSGTKIQAKPGTLFLKKTKLPEMKEIVHVRNNNPRSILIPVPLQDVKELKAFKIVNTTAVQSINAKKVQNQEANQQIQIQQVAKPLVLKEVDLKEKMKEDCFLGNFSSSDSIIIEDGYNDERSYAVDSEVSYPKLALNSEERRLLNKDGISLPSHYPLTKHEERELKRIRRKIRNKISAQDSRKRKKEYVDGLEERVKQCTEENQSLMKKIKQLQNQNHNLVSQMIKLQALLTKGTNKSTQPTTCLMVLLLSLALVAAPNLRLGQNVKKGDLEEAVQETILQNRRSLLFNNKDQSTDVYDEEVNMSDILSVLEFNSERESNAEYKINSKIHSADSSMEEPKCKKTKLVPPGFLDEVDDENWYTSKNDRAKTFGKNGMKYLEQSKQNFQNIAFNIGKSNQISSAKNPSKQEWLDKDIPENLLPTPNGFYKLSNNGITSVSLERPPKLTVLDVTANQIYTKGIQIKQNFSDIRHSKIY